MGLERSAAEALGKSNEWSARPLPLSGSCWHDGRLSVRLSGADSAVTAAQRLLGGEQGTDATPYWRAIREQHHAFFQVASGSPLWRLSVRSTAPYAELGGEQLIEWGGALRWICASPQEHGDRLRSWAKEQGGHATLFRSAGKSLGAFPALAPALLAPHQRPPAPRRPWAPGLCLPPGVRGRLDPLAVVRWGRISMPRGRSSVPACSTPRRVTGPKSVNSCAIPDRYGERRSCRGRGWNFSGDA